MMAKFLEVIVTSVQDAIEAEAGGADRLELVRALHVGGLTPEQDLVAEVLNKVKLPVRVMLRERASMTAGSLGEMEKLQKQADAFANLSIDGLVAGFILDHAPDIASMSEVAAAVPGLPITFHRAFDEVADPFASIEKLKGIPQIDRILTVGGEGDWPIRKKRLLTWQESAGASITILVGAGLCASVLAGLSNTPQLREVHVGRAARIPQSVNGNVRRDSVRVLKSSLP